jgi:hypothetical protein
MPVVSVVATTGMVGSSTAQSALIVIVAQLIVKFDSFVASNFSKQNLTKVQLLFFFNGTYYRTNESLNLNQLHTVS